MIPSSLELGPLQLITSQLEILGGLGLVWFLLQRHEPSTADRFGGDFFLRLVVAAAIGAKLWAILISPSVWSHPLTWFLVPFTRTGAIAGAFLLIVWHVKEAGRPVPADVRRWLRAATGATFYGLVILAVNRSDLAPVVVLLALWVAWGRVRQLPDWREAAGGTLFFLAWAILLADRLSQTLPPYWTPAHVVLAGVGLAGLLAALRYHASDSVGR
ncbi:hypothetical protein TPY_0906 [Sulfobacillus acidophilus TPY]|uniref:Uncharacterized protein n=1 Tax=Sulfobacillus acidophilus (strain ATCC 700253 / DSM 10332 / NAL) TaxID=679936 RepID=G8TXZ6_SULAD|nr:hypothetical protein TPY_0906 [Sulfobacillus acidophilus TPY]AEW06202.1 hypothetical protein Sulac_2740 [Sulfobacillus acidophilus DSM 10332]